MASGGPQHTKRALVKVLLAIAALYSCSLELNRDSPDEVVNKAFKKVSLKAHPDKGGLLKHAQALNAAKDAWDKARKGPKRGKGCKASTDKDQAKRIGRAVAAGEPVRAVLLNYTKQV